MGLVIGHCVHVNESDRKDCVGLRDRVKVFRVDCGMSAGFDSMFDDKKGRGPMVLKINTNTCTGKFIHRIAE